MVGLTVSVSSRVKVHIFPFVSWDHMRVLLWLPVLLGLGTWSEFSFTGSEGNEEGSIYSQSREMCFLLREKE